jgi:hypothetical protein
MGEQLRWKLDFGNACGQANVYGNERMRGFLYRSTGLHTLRFKRAALLHIISGPFVRLLCVLNSRNNEL